LSSIPGLSSKPWFLPIPTRFQVTTSKALFLKQLSYLILGEKLGSGKNYCKLIAKVLWDIYNFHYIYMILWLEILTFCEQGWQKDDLNLVSPSAVFLQVAALTVYQGCKISVKDLLKRK